MKTFALVSVYSAPDESLLRKSSGVLAVCKYKGSQALTVIRASTIVSVVAMVPYPLGIQDEDYFLVEKLGLDIAHLAGHDEALQEE